MNKKFIIGIIVSFLWLAVAFSVFAQPRPPLTPQDLHKRIQEQENQIKRLPPNLKDRPGLGDESRVRANVQSEIKNMREAAQKRLETMREEAKKAAETRQVELKDKIGKLRDEKKRQTATRLNEQLARLNVQWTDHFNNALNRLSEILGKVELRASKAETIGKDVSAVKTAIQNAKAAIETARTAVETQAKKTYTATFTSEDKLGAAFKAVREQLKTDLFGLRDGAMKSAREAVQSAHQSLKGLNF